MAGVSRIVAGHVLLGSGGKTTRVGRATADRVRVAAQELGYRPNQAARQLKGARSQTIGVMIGSRTNQVLYDRLQAIEREAFERGYRLMVGYVHQLDQYDDYLNDFQVRGIDGLILLHDVGEELPASVRDHLACLKHVVYQDFGPTPTAACVRVDRADGIRQAVRHLLSRGRRRIGLALTNATRPQMIDRQRGFAEELAAQGLPLLPERVWCAGSPNHPLAPAEESARAEQALAEFILPQRLDAVIVGNDVWAVHLLKALQRRQIRVPDDLAIVGFDNLDLGLAVTPELTTVDQENAVVAYHLVTLVVNGIEGRPGPADPGPVLVKPRLVIRQTT